MRSSHQCPKCQSRKLLVVDPVQSRDDDGLLRTHSLTSVQFYGSVLDVGRVEAWVCTACGYLEYYTTSVGDLLKVAQQPGGTVRSLDGSGAGGAAFR